MSGIRGKGTVSVKKKKDALSRLASTGYKNLEFMHEASAGDTIINLQSLSAPAQAVANGFAQPNAVDLAKVDLRYYKSNLILRSTLGSLTPFIDYKISGAQTIELLREAEDGEIFIGTLQTVARTGQTLVDAAPLVVTGTLPAGQTDFSVGPYEVNKFPGQDHGSVLVIEDGQIVYRNDGNQEASLAVSGDYQEVSNIIRFNTTSPDDRQISVVSIGALVNRPQESFDAVAEALQGQIDAIVPTLAALAGVPETDFQATPNNTDLKAFGDAFLALKASYDSLVNGQHIYQVGDVIHSMLTEAQFTSLRGEGWVMMDGRSVVGSVYEQITGSSTVPDARGQVLRCKNNGRSDGQQDPDGERALGSQQSHQIQSHNHVAGFGENRGGYARYGLQSGLSSAFQYAGTGFSHTQAPLTSATGDNETRMKNICVNIFIKVN